MAGYKHSIVDDYPYIVYTSQADGTPDLITAVEIDPLTASVAQGGTQTFVARVMGSGNFDDAVAWSLAVESGGTIKTGTAVSNAGVLSVAASQATTKALYVTATAANGVSATATVTVTS